MNAGQLLFAHRRLNWTKVYRLRLAGIELGRTAEQSVPAEALQQLREVGARVQRLEDALREQAEDSSTLL